MLSFRSIELARGEQTFDPSKVPGHSSRIVGERAADVSIRRQTLSTAGSLTPLQDLHGTITPSDLHFERHHGGVPEIKAESHTLLIHGLVDKALSFTLADLKRFPAVTRTCFIECSGNFCTIAEAPEKSTAQIVCGLTSQSEWTGVALSTLLREVGAKSSASWLLAEGGDSALMTRSIPIDKALDDAIIAWAQNGEPLRPEQGYPIRLLLPGWEGNTNVKWLRRIEVGDAPFMTREETAKYTEAVQGRGIRQFSFEMGPRSIITSPSTPYVVDKGWQEITGIAWSGAGKISAVEVSVDSGKTWQNANLIGPVLSKAHTRFGLMWHWDGCETVILSRTIDETGGEQPTSQQLFEERGADSGGYHMNPVVGWHILGTGETLFAADFVKPSLSYPLPSALINAR